MRASEHRTQGDPAQPYVAMDRGEALLLALALRTAIGRLEDEFRRLSTVPTQATRCADLGTELSTLKTFLGEHERAHELRTR